MNDSDTCWMHHPDPSQHIVHSTALFFYQAACRQAGDPQQQSGTQWLTVVASSELFQRHTSFVVLLLLLLLLTSIPPSMSLELTDSQATRTIFLTLVRHPCQTIHQPNCNCSTRSAFALQHYKTTFNGIAHIFASIIRLPTQKNHSPCRRAWTIVAALEI